MDELKSFLDTLDWKIVDDNGNVLQAVINHDDFCKYVFSHERIFVGDRVLEVKCNGLNDGLNLTYTLTFYQSCYFCFFR